MKKLMLIIWACCLAHGLCAQKQLSIKIIGAKDQQAIANITVMDMANNRSQQTNEQGLVLLNTAAQNISLKVSGMGYKTKTVTFHAPYAAELLVQMDENVGELQEVEVSTGYQRLPKERATGSFVQVNNELLNRAVGTNVLDRLQDVVPGLSFNRGIGRNAISIRGTSTIFANAEPLIILDNFPFEGDLAAINPNDVESITVLKDAAAVSQWGARAGNGVIVITSKQGKKGKVNINLQSNISMLQKEDAFYIPQMSANDYIDTETRLFNEGYYNSTATSSNRLPLTPVVELLIRKRNNPSLAAGIDAQINALRVLDVRNDYSNYYYQKGLNQQYSVNLSGGNEQSNYFVSAGHDRNRLGMVGNDFNRTTLNANYGFEILPNKLKLTAMLAYVGGNTGLNNNGLGSLGLSNTALYPYAQLADGEGNALVIDKLYSNAFVNEAMAKGLLDWNYRPLEELALANRRNNTNNLRLNGTLRYTIADGISTEVLYQYIKNEASDINRNSEQSYFARNLINNLTQVNADGSFTRPIPLGGIVDQSDIKGWSHNVRGQFNLAKRWQQHDFNVIAGAELREVLQSNNAFRLYGYDEEHATNKAVDYVSVFPRFVNPLATGVPIEYRNTQKELVDRFISYYANGAYVWRNRYTISASARLDRSNLFGVESNQRGVPLWSAGLVWNIANEDFFQWRALPILKLRSTLGYSGNIDKTLAAYTTASYSSGSSTLTRLPFATIVNPPNPGLRWERIRMFNVALDFATKNNWLSGSIEVYAKKGTDLIGTIPYAPSSGINTLKGNFANTNGNGLDLNLNASQHFGIIGWNGNFFLSYVKDEVTAYTQSTTLNSADFIQVGYGALPLVGKPLYALYSYAWGGLDPTNGNPRGYINNELSQNYNGIRAATNTENMVYHGNARPTTFGAFRNDFSYQNLSLSVNISYRFDYYFRKRSINYATNYGLGSHGDYALRWRAPGDELHTDIPSVPLTVDRNNSMRSLLYTYGEHLVGRGDHIRLQDIKLTYAMGGKLSKQLGLRSMNSYVMANNIGLLWKANRWGIDPDFQTNQSLVTYSVGLNLSL